MIYLYYYENNLRTLREGGRYIDTFWEREREWKTEREKKREREIDREREREKKKKRERS